jgi:hypothetical protein
VTSQQIWLVIPAVAKQCREDMPLFIPLTRSVGERQLFVITGTWSGMQDIPSDCRKTRDCHGSPGSCFCVFMWGSNYLENWSSLTWKQVPRLKGVLLAVRWIVSSANLVQCLGCGMDNRDYLLSRTETLLRNTQTDSLVYWVSSTVFWGQISRRSRGLGA